METKVKKAINDFINDPNEELESIKQANEAKKEILGTRTGLIERVDKIYVTEDGRQLLREQY